VMALSVAASALLLGLAADRLRRRGVPTEGMLGATLGTSMVAQASLLLGLPVPAHLPWALIAAAGAATVLSFAIVTGYFPSTMSARASAALNLLHIGAAFLLQSATGFVIALWPHVRDGYPPQAHRAAMAAGLLLQIAAFAWFVAPRRLPAIGPGIIRRYNRGRVARRAAWRIAPPYYARRPRAVVAGWPLAASVGTLLSITLAVALLIALSRPAVAVHVLDLPPGPAAILVSAPAELVHGASVPVPGDPNALCAARTDTGEASQALSPVSPVTVPQNIWEAHDERQRQP
jgi:hypothetical protein